MSTTEGRELRPSRSFSRTESVCLVAVPLAWAIVLLFHPTGDGEDFYPIVRDQVTRWELVHVATLVLLPLMAAVGLLLLRGVEGTSAKAGRIAFLIFAVFYTAWEAVIGIGTGVLTDEVNQLAEADRATGATLVEDFTDSGLIRTIEYIGTGAWLVAMLSTGYALVRHAEAPKVVFLLLALCAIPTAWHVPPFGQVGLALFIGAVVLVIRTKPSHQGAGLSAQPMAT